MFLLLLKKHAKKYSVKRVIRAALRITQTAAKAVHFLRLYGNAQPGVVVHRAVALHIWLPSPMGNMRMIEFLLPLGDQFFFKSMGSAHSLFMERKHDIELPVTPWLERDWRIWQPSIPLESVCDALMAFPQRLSDTVMACDASKWTAQTGEAWSVQEHVGHLLAMESLWIARIDDFVMGSDVLRPWNGHNNDVRMARFNDQKMGALLRDFKDTRSAIVEFSAELIDQRIGRLVLNERLDRRFSLYDHLAFIAEHDAHHLACIQFLIAS